MKRFKEFLMESDYVAPQEGDVIGKKTMRQILYDRYGKAKADELIQSIRERQAKYGVESPEFRAAVAQFDIPEYSEESLDKEYTFKADNDPTAVGYVMRSNPNDIFLNPNQPAARGGVQEVQGTKPPVGRVPSSIGGYILDLVGHEATHQNAFAARRQGYQHGFRDRPTDAPREYPKVSPTDTPDEAQTKIYAQSREEPTAHFAELKHWYFMKTNKILRADMSPEEKKSLIDLYNKEQRGKRLDMDASVDLLEKDPRAEEVFRRTAKAEDEKEKRVPESERTVAV